MIRIHLQGILEVLGGRLEEAGVTALVRLDMVHVGSAL